MLFKGFSQQLFKGNTRDIAHIAPQHPRDVLTVLFGKIAITNQREKNARSYKNTRHFASFRSNEVPTTCTSKLASFNASISCQITNVAGKTTYKYNYVNYQKYEVSPQVV